MDLPVIFVGSFVTALSGALAPGPLLTLTIAETLKRGALSGPLIITGHALLELVIVTLLSLGLLGAVGSDATLVLTGSIGSIVLFYMGMQTIREAGRVAETSFSGAVSVRLDARSAGSLVIRGALTSVANPYWSLWWLTIGAAFLARGLLAGTPGAVAFFVGHILADFAWYTIVSTAVHKGKKAVNGKVVNAILVVCGSALIGLGVYFALDVARRVW